jgi:hypothetical protein
VFILLFVVVMVGFYFTVGADVVGLGGGWSLFVLLVVLLLLVSLFFVI